MLTVIRNGVETNVADGSLCYLNGYEGWGHAPLHRITERGPMQHGDTDVDYRLDPREASLIFLIPGESWLDMRERWRRLQALFAPGPDPIKLRWEIGVTRQIDCYLAGAINISSGDRAGYTQLVPILLRAPDPTFYDPEGAAVSFALGGGSDAFEVPMEIPHPVGVSVIDQVNTISYAGNAPGYPHLIRITGPITDPVLTNETTDEVLDFTGVTIAAGDHYDIDLRYGQKTVEDSNGDDKGGDLTEESDLTTWHLAPAPEPGTESDPRQNSIRLTGNNITEATKVEVAYFERYLES